MDESPILLIYVARFSNLSLLEIFA